MQEQLDLEILRFNVHKDYLPYIHREVVVIDEDEKLSGLYALLDSTLLDFGYDKHNVAVKINNILVHKDVRIALLCEHFGREWRMESYAPRATAKDLMVNTALLMSPLECVREVCVVRDDDEAEFIKLLPFCFLSPLSSRIPHFAGEGFFVFIAYMLKAYPKHASNLMQLIASPENGVMNAQYFKGHIFPDVAAFDADIMELQKALLSGYPHYDQYWVDYAAMLKTTLRMPA